MNIEEFRKHALLLGRTTTTAIPGYTCTAAEERAYALLVAAYLGETLDLETHFNGKIDDPPSFTLGRAFCGLNQRMQGNKHATALILHALSLYNGSQVTKKVGSLLEMLERALIASGDVKEELCESEERHEA